nr:unnamed protein product [Digitaria exilis]
MPEPIHTKHLVVGERQRAADPFVAALLRCVMSGRRHPPYPPPAGPGTTPLTAAFLAAAYLRCSLSACLRRSALAAAGDDDRRRSTASYLAAMASSWSTMPSQ